MEDAWKRFENALRAGHDTLPAKLGPPATDEALARLEKALGFPLPAILRRSLKVHGGDALVPAGDGKHFTTQGAIGHLEWLRPSSIAEEWTNWRDEISQDPMKVKAEGPVHAQWWNPKWIPITNIGGETHHHCVDLDPAPGGRVGQIIEVGVEDPRRVVVATGLVDLLDKISSDIHRGKYRMDDDALVLKEEAWDEPRRSGGGIMT